MPHGLSTTRDLLQAKVTEKQSVIDLFLLLHKFYFKHSVSVIHRLNNTQVYIIIITTKVYIRSMV